MIGFAFLWVEYQKSGVLFINYSILELLGIFIFSPFVIILIEAPMFAILYRIDHYIFDDIEEEDYRIWLMAKIAPLSLLLWYILT